MQLSLFADKRWSGRRQIWRRPDRALFDPRPYAVDVVLERAARELVVGHHYSGTFPAARLSVGLFEGRALAGVAVFSVPTNGATVERWAQVPAAEGVELGRFVCLPSVAYNGETWFLRRALALLGREKACRAVVSFADPLERHDAGGYLTKPAHFGTIYQAHNATFRGRARSRWVWVTRAGSIVSERMLSKIAGEERGRDYAERQLVQAGADQRQPLEAPRAWLDRVLREPQFRRVKHPGNFAYVFKLDGAPLSGLAYPRKGEG